MTAPTAKDFEGALLEGARSLEDDARELESEGIAPNVTRPSAALLRRLLDSGFLGAALEYAAKIVGENDRMAGMGLVNDECGLEYAYRRLTAEPSEGGGE